MGTKMHRVSKKRLALLGAAAVPAAAMFGSQAYAAPTVSITSFGTASGGGTIGAQSGWTVFKLIATADTGDVISGIDFTSNGKGIYGQLLQRWTYQTSPPSFIKSASGIQANNSTNVNSLDTHFVTLATQSLTIPGTTPFDEDNNTTNPGLTVANSPAGTAPGQYFGTGTQLHVAYGVSSGFIQTDTLAYIVLKDGQTGTAIFDLAQGASPGGGTNTQFGFTMTFSAGGPPPAGKIISLTAAAPTGFGNKLTQASSPGADQASFSPNNSDSIIHVTGSNGSYVPGFANNVGGTANGQNTFNVEATGWSPATDQEIYALNIKVNGLDPTAGQISAIIADINGSNTGNITAGQVTGAFASVFPGYDILLTAAGGTVSPEFLGVNFANDSTTTGVTVTNVAAVPEPVSAAGLLLGAAGLLLGRRKRNA